MATVAFVSQSPLVGLKWGVFHRILTLPSANQTMKMKKAVSKKRIHCPNMKAPKKKGKKMLKSTKPWWPTTLQLWVEHPAYIILNITFSVARIIAKLRRKRVVVRRKDVFEGLEVAYNHPHPTYCNMYTALWTRQTGVHRGS